MTEIPNEQRFCRDCAYCDINFRDSYLWKCNAEQNKINKLSLITGEKEYLVSTAHQARESGLCGPTGDWYRNKYERRTEWLENHGRNETDTGSVGWRAKLDSISKLKTRKAMENL